MSRSPLSTAMVGNEFVVPPARLRVVAPATSASVVPPLASTPVERRQFTVPDHLIHSDSYWQRTVDLLHHYSLITFALLFLLVSSSATIVGGRYVSSQVMTSPTAGVAITASTTKPSGPNTMVKTGQLAAKIQAVTSQPVSLTLGSQTVGINTDTIKSWLKVTNDTSRGDSYIHVDQTAIASTLAKIVKDHTIAPLNQVMATHEGTTVLIAAGKNGLQPTDPSSVVTQIDKNLLAGQGLQLNVPTQTVAFSVVTPAAFSKLLEVNVVTKEMYAYDNGQLTRTFPISAGAWATPTPIGQYKIYQKLPVQDMSGYNTNGTKYFQPHVHWINYFLPGGYAVHGNYWRPASYFGVINSSHGCVSLPDDQAEWVYDWAPIGTTVITHG